MMSGGLLNLAGLVKNGTLAEALLDESVLRVLELKNWLGLFEDPFHGADEANTAATSLCEEHRKLAYKAAVKSFVLLKNGAVLRLPESKDRIYRSLHRFSGYAGQLVLYGRRRNRGGKDHTAGSGRSAGRLVRDVPYRLSPYWLRGQYWRRALTGINLSARRGKEHRPLEGGGAKGRRGSRCGGHAPWRTLLSVRGSRKPGIY